MSEPINATVGEEEIKRFRVGDVLFNDEQAKMFCDLAMKGLRAEAAPTEEDVQRTVAEIFGSLDPASIVRRLMLASSATARVPLMHTAYSATTGEELRALLGMFTPDIRLVTQDSEPAEAYYRIESDGEGVIVVKPMEMSQVGDPQTNGGCLE